MPLARRKPEKKEKAAKESRTIWMLSDDRMAQDMVCQARNVVSAIITSLEQLQTIIT